MPESKVQDIKNTALSIAKAAPLLTGALVGLTAAPSGGSQGPLSALLKGQWESALDGLTANYTFYSIPNGEFYPNQGKGIKALLVGGVVSKILGWLL